MFPDNPNLLEQLGRTKMDDVQREVQKSYDYPGKPKPISKIMAASSLLIALIWLLSVVL